MRAFSLFLTGLALALSPAQAVTVNFGGLDFRDNSNTLVSDGRLFLLLANTGGSFSTSGSGFNTLQTGTLNVGDYLNGNYQVLARAGLSDNGSFGSNGVATFTLGDSSNPFVNTGDQLAVVWFPTLGATIDFNLNGGTSYGLYTVNNSGAWQVPGPADTISLTVPSGSLASFSAIPEPGTWAALAGGAALVVAGWRRRKPAKES